jgi:methylated-DNA-[protein]-cysteine S-methyltransferase
MPSQNRQSTIASPWGPMVGMRVDEALGGLWFAGQAHFPDLTDVPEEGYSNHPLWSELTRGLEAYAAGQRQTFNILLAPQGGSPFAQRVWSALQGIPWGRTVSYGDLARQLTQGQGLATSARAVGSAVGRNPISILIPCHRVVGADGRLTGYAGGIEKKAALLRLERAID